MEIEKTNRMNALFEFYSTLLTEKQMNYMELYYADDFSLGELWDLLDKMHVPEEERMDILR